MANVAAYPLAAPADRVRVWVGVFGAANPPALSIQLSGSNAQPDVLRPLTAVRAGPLLDPADQLAGRAFTGVFEFTGLPAGSAHTINVSAGGQTVAVPVSTLPAALPERSDQPLNVLLCSCYDQGEDRSGLVSTIVSQIKLDPALSLFLGDQVYLDIPTLEDFPGAPAKLAKKFEDKYTTNWTSDHLGTPGLSKVLSRAAAAFVPDDHEYWNNFPHPAAVIQNSWTKPGRDGWKAAGRAVYEGFQLAPGTTLGGSQVIDVAPLSFFLLDARSERREDRSFAVTLETRARLRAWVDGLIAHKDGSGPCFGVLVSGQPLLADKAGPTQGRIFDFNMPDYDDFGAILGEIERLIANGLPLLYITGDVHYGRVSCAIDLASGRTAIYEVISSPSSLVTSVGVDQLKRLGSAFMGLFGRKNPWPRHSDPEPPPDRFGSTRSLQPQMLHAQKGDQLTMLSFWRAGAGVEFAVTYYPIHPDKAVQKSVRLEGFRLRAFF